MAEKVNKKHAAPASAKAAEDELAILHPEREVFLAGQRVVMREYGFVEGLKLRATAEPFIAALTAQAMGGHAPSFVDIEALLAEHQDCVIALIAQAADVDVAWVQGLSDEDGYRLMQEWWLVNANFFIRRVVQRLAHARARENSPAGPASTTRSSAAAMEPARPTSDGSLPGS